MTASTNSTRLSFPEAASEADTTGQSIRLAGYRLTGAILSLCILVTSGLALERAHTHPFAIALILAVFLIPCLGLGEALADISCRTFLRKAAAQASATDVLEAPPLLVLPVILAQADTVEAVAHWIDANLPHSSRLPLVLLVDLPDAPSECMPEDGRLLETLRRRVSDYELRGEVLIASRRRRYDPVDAIWRGWERKRGKLLEFCRLLRGDRQTDFIGDMSELGRVTCFVTIDLDTRLRPNTIFALVRAAVQDAAIVNPKLCDSVHPDPNFFQALWRSRPADPLLEPEPTFSQGWLGRDLFCGKGLIRIDDFLLKIEGKIPERTVLSHDHLEALIAGAVSTPLAVIDEHVPQNRRLWAARQHRWTRGDFQLLRWVFGQGLPIELRSYLIDNLLRHLTPPSVILTIAASWIFLPTAPAGAATACALLCLQPRLTTLPLDIVATAIIPAIFMPGRRRLLRHKIAEMSDAPPRLWLAAFLFCGADALLTLRAATITGWRLLGDGRQMLEWNDLAYLEKSRRWARSGWAIGCAAGVASFALGSTGSFIIGSLILMWTCTPALCGGDT